jgi:hypothetical protein
LQNLAKLAIAKPGTQFTNEGTEGRMTAAYNATLKRMFDPERAGREGAEFTPHVDKVWHMPGALPELHAEENARIVSHKAKAFVAAQVLGLLRPEQHDRRRFTRISTLGHGVRGGVDTELAESHDTWEVYKGLTAHVQATRSTLDIWQRRIGAPAEDIASHAVHGPLVDPATLMTLLSPAQVRTDAVGQRDAAVVNILVAWIGMVRELVEAQGTGLSVPARESRAEDMVNAAREAFFERVRGERFSEEVMRRFDTLFAQAYDAVFAK